MSREKFNGKVVKKKARKYENKVEGCLIVKEGKKTNRVGTGKGKEEK